MKTKFYISEKSGDNVWWRVVAVTECGESTELDFLTQGMAMRIAFEKTLVLP
jgi:hypothetical protein